MATPLISGTNIGGTVEHQNLGLVESIELVSAESFEQLLNGMFDGADDSLFAMSEKAASNEDQALFFDAMRALRLDRKKITQCCVSLVRDLPTSTSIGDNDDPSPDDEFSELELQDSEDLEEQVAVENMIGKGFSYAREAIGDLETRLEFIAKEYGEPIQPKSLGPDKLCQAFKLSMDPVAMSIDLRLLIYKLFDQHVISRLNEFYSALNNLLMGRGILPKIRRAARISKKATGAQASTPKQGRQLPEAQPATPNYPHAGAIDPNVVQNHPAPAAPGYTGAPAGHFTTTHLLSSIESDISDSDPLEWATQTDLAALLRSQLGNAPLSPIGGGNAAATQATHGTPGAMAEGTALPGAHLGGENTGTGLAAHPAGGLHSGSLTTGTETGTSSHSGSGDPAASFASQIQNQITGDDDAPLPLQDEVQAVEVVSRFFKDILSDSHITKPARTELARLKLPIVKTALADLNFFRDPQHPARAVMHELAGIGAMVRDTASPAYAQITSLVDRLIDNYGKGPQEFRRAAKELQKISAEEAKRFLREEKQFTEDRRKQAIDHAKEIVRETIDKIAGKQGLPEETKTFVYKLWAPYMAIQFLRHGSKSEAWKNSCDQLQAVIDLIRAKRSKDNQERASALLQTMQGELQAADAAPERIKPLTESLYSAFDIQPQTNEDFNKADASEGEDKDTLSSLLAEEEQTTTIENQKHSDLISIVPAESKKPRSDHSSDASLIQDTAEGVEVTEQAAQTTQAAEQITNQVQNTKKNEDKTPELDQRKTKRAKKLLEGLLHPGAWFRLYESNDKRPQWLRFAEYEDHTSTVVLLGSQGVVYRYPVTEFADEIIGGACRPVMDNSEFEQLMAEVGNSEVETE